MQLHKNLKAHDTGLLTSVSKGEIMPTCLRGLSILWHQVCSFADPGKLAISVAGLQSLGWNTLCLQALTAMLSGKSRVSLPRSGTEVLHLGPVKSMYLWCYKAGVVSSWLSAAQVHQQMSFLDLLRSFDRLENPIRLLSLCEATDPLLQTDLSESNWLSYLIKPVHNMAGSPSCLLWTSSRGGDHPLQMCPAPNTVGVSRLLVLPQMKCYMAVLNRMCVLCVSEGACAKCVNQRQGWQSSFHCWSISPAFTGICTLAIFRLAVTDTQRKLCSIPQMHEKRLFPGIMF